MTYNAQGGISASIMKAAFIGLGRMGSAMAGNLIKAGHEITVFNRTREKSEALAEQGARVARSIEDAVKGCESVLTMLADDAALEEVVFGQSGIARFAPESAIHISLSTISVRMAKRLALEHQQRRQGYVSAPVFGRPDAAAAKRLLVVAAGEGAVIEKVRGLLDAMGRQTYVAGDEPWQANLLKLNGNFMIASMIESFGEAVAVLRKAAANPQVFYEIITELFGSPIYKNYGASIVNESFEPALFLLKLGLKDIRLGLDAADELNVPMPLASVLRDQFIGAMANGQEELDWTSVSLTAARMGGLTGKKL